MNVATGSFDSVKRAEEAVNALRDAGFAVDHIGVFARDQGKGTTLANDLGRRFAMGTTPPSDVVVSDTDIYDRLPDGFIDTIHRSKLPDDAIDWYNSCLDRGYVLVSVNVDGRMDDADRIIREHGGVLYIDRGRMKQPQAGRMAGEATMMEGTTMTPEGEVHLPVIDEEINVDKTRHEIGEVRVTSETSTETVDLPTMIEHQEIRVERRRLDQPMRPDEYKGSTAPEKGVIRMPIVEEEVRVTKVPVIREELVIRRRPVTEETTVHETVMHTEPNVETTGDVEVERRAIEEEKKRPAA